MTTATGPTGQPRRDPRRLFTKTERSLIAASQQHQCSVCRDELPEVFHVHHVVPWAEGGWTTPNNGTAVCPDCHRLAPIRQLPTFAPRAWQTEALDQVANLLRAGEFATVNAAPGAGKTLFTAWAYRNLADAGAVGRLVVFVPNANLRTQWHDDVKPLNVYLNTNGTSERSQFDGSVLTYHCLSDPRQVDQIIDDALATPTLFVLDEVHHLAVQRGGDAGSWAVNIANIVGDRDRPRHPVLNLSGTLFRSRASERIATIDYQLAEDGTVETVADYSVTAGRLINERQLRHIKVLSYDATAEVKVTPVNLADSAHDGASDDPAVDIVDSKIRSQFLAGRVRNERFLDGFLDETIRRLGHAATALENAPVKGLIIADSVEHADQIYRMLREKIGQYAFIAHGQSPNADAEIERFRKSSGQAVLVAVQKVTEGFNVPDICVLAYLRTWRAPLFINQMVGRAMRVTDRERESGNFLPAAILVPHDPEIEAAFADVLVGAMQVLEVPPEPCSRCGRELCACLPRPVEKICRRCNMPWKNCVCLCGNCGLTRHGGCKCPRIIRCFPPRSEVEIEIVEDGKIVHIMVDGDSVDLHIVELLAQLARENGLPEVFIEQQAKTFQQTLRANPLAIMDFLRGAS